MNDSNSLFIFISMILIIGELKNGTVIWMKNLENYDSVAIWIGNRRFANVEHFKSITLIKIFAMIWWYDYMFITPHTHTHMHVYIYIYIYRFIEREFERERKYTYIYIYIYIYTYCMLELMTLGFMLYTFVRQSLMNAWSMKPRITDTTMLYIYIYIYMVER